LHGVLVTYRRLAQLENTLKVLDDQRRSLDTLAVVDNDPGGSARRVVPDRPGIEYIHAGENIGPAGGIALGMRHVLGYADDDDWVVLLDDDDPPRRADTLAVLADFGDDLRRGDPTVAAVGKSGTNFNIRLARSIRTPDHMLDGPVPSDCIGGNQVPFISVHAIRTVGVFDERLFFGFEELEYGLRLRAAGFRVYVHGGLWREDRAYHNRLGLRTDPDRRLAHLSWRRYYSIRNLIYILRKRGHPISASKVTARSLLKPLYNIPHHPALAGQHLRVAMRAIADAYLQRMGRTVEPEAKYDHQDELGQAPR
jgi:GT2 family glycosyltransferase